MPEGRGGAALGAAAAAGPGEALVRTLFSGISRGTERLVFEGAIGRSEWERMRAPMQEGAFPFPGQIRLLRDGSRRGRARRSSLGRTVFCLHPHQDCLRRAGRRRSCRVPDGVPARRATLAANMETALNALWDGGAGPGDRIVVVGAGVVGLLVAALAARLPGADVTARGRRAERAGRSSKRWALASRAPTQAPADADVVFHASVNGGRARYRHRLRRVRGAPSSR